MPFPHTIRRRTTTAKMKCQICGEVLINYLYLYPHYQEKHVKPANLVLDRLYSSTNNKWIDRTPRMSRRKMRLGRPPLITHDIAYVTNNNLKADEPCNHGADVMAGKGISRNESHREPENYTFEELRTLLRFHKNLGYK